MNDNDPILEAALEEALGGQTPPDLIAQTLAKAGVETAPPQQPPAGPRPVWRAWGTGLAAAAVVVVVGVFTLTKSDLADFNASEPDAVAKESASGIDDVVMGSEDNAGGQYDGPVAHTKRVRDQVGVQRDAYDRPIGGVQTVSPAMEPKENPQPDVPDGMHFDGTGSNPFVDTEDDPLSTFALEHDTGSYSVVRNYLNGGNLPPDEAVRVEEFVNYFDYDYPKPALDPFSITMDAAPSRYGADLKNCYLMRVGVQAREILPANRKPAVLTFVIDISGSMRGENRLGLVKRALELLVNELREGDLVGIAVYGNNGYQHMSYMDASRKTEIIQSIQALETKGSTNAEEGLKVAYQMASDVYNPEATNRVILCSDGVANVGQTQVEGILDTIVKNRRSGITLSTVGFGMGNYNDNLMEQLGDKGDGHYAYVDSLDEAKRIFVDNLTGTLEVVARDVKIQIEFNPDVVKSYRLIGYVNRDIKDEDFRNDAVDGGEIGAGHAATALYEIKLHDQRTGPIGYTTVRYKEDERDEFKEISQEVFTRDIASSWEQADAGLRLAANVAEFAEILGEGFYAKYAELQPVIEDLQSIQYDFRNDKVEELLKLVAKANELKNKD